MISIIVPIYNVEKYLENCINSILNQSHRDLELILVDDGSPDNSGKICDLFAEKDSRVKVIHKENGGLSSARNAGLKIATGEYVSFIDSDDWVHKDFYLILLKILQDNNSDISICKFKEVINEGFADETILDPKVKVFNNVQALEEIYTENYVNFIIACNKLYKKSLFDNIKFPTGKIHEDEFTIPKVLFNAEKVTYIEEELLYYRQTPNSIMNGKFNEKQLNFLDSIEDRLIFLKANNLETIYKDCTYQLVFETINYYFIVKSSDLSNKNDLMNKLKDRLTSVDINILSGKAKFLINLFKISPSLYKLIKG